MTVATAITIYDVLDDLRSRDLGIRDKGTAFEDLVAKFLTSDPLYADQFASVVPYAEFADEGKRRDLGIDLVAPRRDGGVVAIQCKFFAAHAKVEKRDVDTFLAESGKEPFTERLIVSTTDNWGPFVRGPGHRGRVVVGPPRREPQRPERRPRCADASPSSPGRGGQAVALPQPRAATDRHGD